MGFFTSANTTTTNTANNVNNDKVGETRNTSLLDLNSVSTSGSGSASGLSLDIEKQSQSQSQSQSFTPTPNTYTSSYTYPDTYHTDTDTRRGSGEDTKKMKTTLDLLFLTFNCAKNLIDVGVWEAHLYGALRGRTRDGVAGLPELVAL